MEHRHPCYEDAIVDGHSCEACEYNKKKITWAYRYQWTSVMNELCETHAERLTDTFHKIQSYSPKRAIDAQDLRTLLRNKGKGDDLTTFWDVMA